MRAIFLGGTRFIGLRAVELARERGHAVTVVHRGVHRAQLPSGVDEILVDRGDPTALLRAVARTNADVVIDTYAMTRADARHATESLRDLASRAIVLSSQDVYAQFGAMNGHACEAIEDVVTEASPLSVPFPFRGMEGHEDRRDYDKKDVEAVYREATPAPFRSVTVLRLPAVFGRGDYRRRFGAIVDTLDRGERTIPMQAGGAWRWTHGHVDNVARAIVLAAESNVDGFHVFNVGERRTPTMRERVERIADAMNVSVRFVEAAEVMEPFSLLGKMPNDVVADTSRVRSALGFDETTSEDDAYRDVVDWIREA